MHIAAGKLQLQLTEEWHDVNMITENASFIQASQCTLTGT